MMCYHANLAAIQVSVHQKKFNQFDAYSTMAKIKQESFGLNKSRRFPKKIFGKLQLSDFLRQYQNRKIEHPCSATQLNEIFINP